MTQQQIEQLRCIPIVVVLERQGLHPAEKRAKGVWFKAPWREETEPSLKVDTERNLWYDFGASVGGDVIRLAQYQWNKSFTEACDSLYAMMNGFFSDYAPIQMRPSYQREPNKRMELDYADEQPITSQHLLKYIEDRRISREVAERYCCELHYGREGRHFYALAFKNDSGGYELRNARFKGNIGGKDITTIVTSEGNPACVVFEGFFNFLTYMQLLRQGSHTCITEHPCDYVILNMAGLAARAQPTQEKYRQIHLFLDRDATGQGKTQEVIDRNPGRAVDESYRYEGYNDLNDYLCGKTQNEPQDNIAAD